MFDFHFASPQKMKFKKFHNVYIEMICWWTINKEFISSLRYFKKNNIILVMCLKYCKLSRLRTVMRGNGQYFQHSLEYCLIGLHPDFSDLLTNITMPNIIFANSQDIPQSKKPDQMYKLIAQIVGESAYNVELFGRLHNLHHHWLTVGNQL